MKIKLITVAAVISLSIISGQVYANTFRPASSQEYTVGGTHEPVVVLDQGFWIESKRGSGVARTFGTEKEAHRYIRQYNLTDSAQAVGVRGDWQVRLDSSYFHNLELTRET